jgi:crossover junction endodeoxyribonuclease RuvC
VAIILGIDPGLRHCGWGIIEEQRGELRYLDSGTINPAPKLTMPERLHSLSAELETIITRFQPHSAAIEETFVSVDGQATLKLGQARGAILLTLAQANLPVAEYAARLVKKSISGSGKADKAQMQQMVRYLLPKSNAATPDAADALAVAICHAHHARIQNTESRIQKKHSAS